MMASSDTSGLDTLAPCAFHGALRNGFGIAFNRRVAATRKRRRNRFHKHYGRWRGFSNLSSSNHQHNNRGGSNDFRRTIPKTPL